MFFFNFFWILNFKKETIAASLLKSTQNTILSETKCEWFTSKKKEKYQNCYNEILKRSKNMHVYAKRPEYYSDIQLH